MARTRKPKSPIPSRPCIIDSNAVVDASKWLLSKVFARYEEKLDDPDTPGNVLVAIGKEVRELAGYNRQSLDITNSDGSLSPMDITVTFDVAHAGKA